MRAGRWIRWSCGSLALLAGCLGLDKSGSDNYFTHPQPPGPLPPLTPASTEAAARVDTIGRRILCANPQLGVRPMFRTIGAPQPEVFHRGTSDICITEGLVNLCQTDGQLAAILATQLGKMIAEREAATPASVRQPALRPPISTPLATDSLLGTAPDQTRLRELADFETPRQLRNQQVAPPEAATLTRVTLLRAGFHDCDLQAAVPLLQKASESMGLERQMTNQPPVR